MTLAGISGSILLTGAGGDIGIALARVLREALPGARIIGADCDSNAPGEAFVDDFLVLPPAQAPDFLRSLEQAVVQSKALAVIPLAEAELARLLRASLIGESFAGAALVTANAGALAIGLDKLTTARTLQAAGLDVPETGLVGEDEPGDFDVIIKPRSGQGSKGLVQVQRSEYAHAAEGREGYIWQRWLKDNQAEFTCGLVRLPGMSTRSICFRRSLRGGLTGTGEVVYDPKLEQLCLDLAEAIDLEGAINVQLRMDAGTPRVFEVNPRFSSTVGFRHRLGFQDAIWSLQQRLDFPIGRYDPPPTGTRIDRVATELIRSPLA